MDLVKLKRELIEQKNSKFKGNIYHFSEVAFAYNSNKIEGGKLTEDETEEITKKVKDILINKNILYKRLVEAFPNFMNPKERLLLIKARVEKELKKYMKKDKK